MQEKPNSQSKVPMLLAFQFLQSSPGRPPAAVSARSVGSRGAVDRADHVGIGGHLDVGRPRNAGRPSGSRRRIPGVARSSQAAGAFQPASPAESSVRPTWASPTTASARCLVASKRAALSAISLTSGLPNTVQEPVVKSWSRVPTASTTSASAASALADALPITPSAPALFGWSWGSTARPAMVSTTGTRWVAAKVASSSAVASA